MSKEKKVTANAAKDPLLQKVQVLFDFGDFYQLRHICKAELKKEGLSPEKEASLRDFLHMTGFDKIVILVGIAAVLFTTAVSILTAY